LVKSHYPEAGLLFIVQVKWKLNENVMHLFANDVTLKKKPNHAVMHVAYSEVSGALVDDNCIADGW